MDGEALSRSHAGALLALLDGKAAEADGPGQNFCHPVNSTCPILVTARHLFPLLTLNGT